MLERSTAFRNITRLCTSNFIGFIYRGEEKRALKTIYDIEDDINSRKCAGIGELGLRHYDKSGKGKQHVVEKPWQSDVAPCEVATGL